MSTATTSNNGLMSISQYKRTYLSKGFLSNKLVKICSHGMFDMIIGGHTFGCGFSINISSSNSGTSNVRCKVIGETALSDVHFEMYIDNDGIYIKSKSNIELFVLRSTINDFIILEESSKQTSDLQKLNII